MDPQLEQVIARLAAIEDGNAQQQAMQQQNQFMGQYGDRFGNDPGIGTAILGELDRRGIDTSAADEAVQDILDNIRAEATAILDKIKMDERTVGDMLDKVGAMEEAVAMATGAAPGADMNIGTPPPPVDMGMGMGGAADPMSAGMDAGLSPPLDGASALPADTGSAASPAETPVSPEGSMPPEPAVPPAAEEPLPPSGVLSDERLKAVRSRVAAVRRPPAPPKPAGWKPSRGMLSAIKGAL